MGSRFIGVDFELYGIKSFFEMACNSVDAKYLDASSRAEAGEFRKYAEEESNAFIDVLWMEEIAIRAVLGELNALVEWELQSVAAKPFHQKQNKKQRKNRRRVSDVSRGELVPLVEGFYGVKVETLPGFPAVEEVRRTINAYKHRRGFKHPDRDPDFNHQTWTDTFKLEREATIQYIDAVRNFLAALIRECR